MAGRSQHGDNRSSYFSADLGRSGVYDSVNGTPINFSQRGDNPNDLRNTEGISETARESGLYASRIGSIKQPIEDYSKETIGSTDNFHRQNWDQSFEEGNRTPESGTYSRNIESHQRGGMDYKENDDITRSSTFDNTRDSGLYSRKIGSFRETIPDKDVATPFPDNPGLDNQRQSSKIFKPNKYTGNTLETMLEGEDESKQPEHSTFFSESRKISDTRRNTDYDGHSNASFQDDKEIPTWTDMMFDRQFTDEYIKKKWPKITLPLANTRKNDPFVTGIVDEGSITIDDKSGTHDHKVRNTLCVIGLGTLLLCLVGAAIITIALLADQRTDKTDYVKVNMTVAINQTFTPGLNDTESTEYKTFATEFCSEMENVYASESSSVDGYFGCKVIQLTDGSIIVNYVIYFISTANQQVTTDTVSTTLITHLTVSGTQLGSLVVITSTIIVHDVATETLESPPAVDKIATTTTLKSTIETTTKENVPSTETTPASETVQQTEATTLKTMQSTAETTSLIISSTKETTPNTQSTTEVSTPYISSTEETTPKNMQSTTDNSAPTITSTGDTTSKAMQLTTETTTPLITSPGETTPNTVQSTTETTTPLISSTDETTQKNMQSTTETTTPSMSPTEETTQKIMQSTTETTTPSISSTAETTPISMKSTTEITTPLMSPTEETTQKIMQSTTETTTPSISSTDETTPKIMQSTTEITTPSMSSTGDTTSKAMQLTTETTTLSFTSTRKTTPNTMQSTTETTINSISSTEKITQKTMQSTRETTTSSISSTLEPMYNPSTDQLSEETTTKQAFKTTKATLEPTSRKTAPTEETISPTSKEETTTLTSIFTKSSTDTFSQSTTSVSKGKTTTSSSVPSMEDTTKPVTSTSTEDQTKPLTSTPTKDSIQPLTSTQTEDTTQPVTSTPTEDTTKPITTTPTEDTTKPITTTPTEDTTKPITTTPTKDTTKPITTTPTEDTTIPMTFTQTEAMTKTVTFTLTEDTTQPIPSTPTQNPTQPVTFTLTDDTTQPMTSTPTEDTTQPVTSIPTEDTTKKVTTTPTEETTKPVISTPTEESTQPVTSTSTEYTSKPVISTSTDDTTKPATSMSTTEMTTSVEITTVSSATTESQNIGLNCTDSLNGVLYSGPVAILCTIQISEQFDYIGISHGDGANNSIYGILLNKDGITLQMYVENPDINVEVNRTSTINLSLTLKNISCAMDGFYKVALLRNMSGEIKESVSRNVRLEVSSPAQKPILTLNADQVIDLLFPDGNYFRNGKYMHQCVGYVGHPPSNLEIHITYDNGTNFETIPNENIYLDPSNMSDGCRNMEVLEFGLRFTQAMVGAKLRCRVKDSTDDFTLSEELSLIPRNICNCAVSKSYRGHPNNCKVQVYCIEDGGIAYPTGIACPANECRNSITGDCTTNCSDSICEETVPSDFCTTPAPPTTTPAPSPYISCTDVSVLINSGPAVVTCSLNDTATFTMMNVTYRKLSESNVQLISTIYDNNTVVMLAMQEIVSISMSDNIINITILNPSCENEGIFGIIINVNGESVMSQGKFAVSSKPSGYATLKLHPDQIAGLENYRDWLLHSCEIDIGYPAGEIKIEILKEGDAAFNNMNVNFDKTTDVVDNVTCSINRTVEFGIRFTSDMNNAIIRCSVQQDSFPDDPIIYSNNDTVVLIPFDLCKDNTVQTSYLPHPTNCKHFVQCEKNVTYSKPCLFNLCFGIYETSSCNHCYLATCPADVTTTSTSTQATTEFIPSIDVSCTDSSVLQNSGPTQIVCAVNATSFSMINVTFIKSSGADPLLITRIENDGSVIDTITDDYIVISYAPLTVTITIQNVSCPYEGFYGVSVDSGNDLTGRAEGKLSVTAKPSGTVDIKLHSEQIAGLTIERLDNVHSCTGDVGNPGGKISVELLLEGDYNFQTHQPSYEKITDTAGNCTVTREFKFWIAFTAAMNNATLRCKITNDKFPTDPPIYSKNETLALVPVDFCNKNYNGTNRYHHPTDCNRYVLCNEKVMYVQACSGSLCFDSSIGTCNHCDALNCP